MRKLFVGLMVVVVLCGFSLSVLNVFVFSQSSPQEAKFGTTWWLDPELFPDYFACIGDPRDCVIVFAN